MKNVLRNALLIIASMACMASLVSCGGGGSGYGGSSSSDPSGSSSVTALVKTDTLVGTGATAAAGNTVSVNYTGWLYNKDAVSYHGTMFDSSAAGHPFTFVLGGGHVISGWDQGVVGMKVGGKRTLIIPSSMAYGATGYGPIPANAALVFDIELVSVQ